MTWRPHAAAIVRAARIADPRGLARAVMGAQVGALEVTLTTDGALDAIAEIAADGHVHVGAGTVLSAEDARASLRAGARFLVTPGVLPAVAEVAGESGVPVVIRCRCRAVRAARSSAGACPASSSDETSRSK